MSLSVCFYLATSTPGQWLVPGLAGLVADQGAAVPGGACVDSSESWAVTLFLLLEKPR